MKKNILTIVTAFLILACCTTAQAFDPEPYRTTYNSSVIGYGISTYYSHNGVVPESLELLINEGWVPSNMINQWTNETITADSENGEAGSWAVKYIDETAPWILARDDDKRERLATVIFSILESLRFIAVLLFPFMPASSEKMWKALGISQDISKQNPVGDVEWGKLVEGATVSKIPPLFPRIEQ